jgi:hypothetical protein
MNTTPFSSLGKISVLAAAILATSAFQTLPVRALDNPINPNAPSPNAGVERGARAAGDSTARRPGNLPKYGPRSHSFTGVTSKTP